MPQFINILIIYYVYPQEIYNPKLDLTTFDEGGNTSNDIKLADGENEGHGVMPVRTVNDNGELENPILLMKLSKN